MGRLSFRRALLAGTALVPLHLSIPAQAASPTLPAGGSFAAGSGAIAQSGASLTVQQSSNRAVINWQGFSIGAGGTVTIANGAGATLNRVTGNQASQIAGQLKSSGSVYLVNPNGVLVMPGGRVMTGGDFVASSLGPTTQAFMAGGALTLSGSSRASVQNAGTIASRRGDVLLIARDVTNTGSISAPAGSANLVAAQQVVLTEAASGGAITVELPGGDVTNSGAIAAARVRLSAAGGNIYALAGNNGGLIQATGTSKRGGRVWLSAGGDTTVEGTIVASGAKPGAVTIRSGGTTTVTGKVAASSTAGKGGRIDINSGRVVLTGARVDASGPAGGGTIALGGKHDAADAAGTVIVDAASSLLANGGTGGGGSVSLWSTGLTDFRGTLTAAGGPTALGGTAEVSTHGILNFDGSVGLAGGLGPGQLLLDPPSAVQVIAGGGAIGASTVDPTAVVNALASANVTLAAGTGGITVSSPVIWSTVSKLTLDSGGTISVNATLSQAAPIGGTGGISLIAGSDIYIAASIIGTGGPVNILANANTSGTGGGITVGGLSGTLAQIVNASATQTGVSITIATTGNVTLGGGTARDGSGFAVGLNSFAQMGIPLVPGASINAAGTVTLRGQGGGGSFPYGIDLFNGSITGGSVSLTGQSGATGPYDLGVVVGDSGGGGAGDRHGREPDDYRQHHGGGGQRRA